MVHSKHLMTALLLLCFNFSLDTVCTSSSQVFSKTDISTWDWFSTTTVALPIPRQTRPKYQQGSRTMTPVELSLLVLSQPQSGPHSGLVSHCTIIIMQQSSQYSGFSLHKLHNLSGPGADLCSTYAQIRGKLAAWMQCVPRLPRLGTAQALGSLIHKL